VVKTIVVGNKSAIRVEDPQQPRIPPWHKMAAGRTTRSSLVATAGWWTALAIWEDTRKEKIWCGAWWLARVPKRLDNFSHR
jgi:hypothetical protein